jgi:penicillin amidase
MTRPTVRWHDHPEIRRDCHGIPNVTALGEPELYYCQGQAHATDRGLQMILMRLVGQGRISEWLDSSDASLKVDKFFRRANWFANTGGAVEELDAHEQNLLDAYCQGVNRAFAQRVPWECKLCRYRPEPWEPRDTLLMLCMLGYSTLASSQGEMERLLVEMIQGGIAEEKLNELFPGVLGGLDANLLKRVKLGERLVPAELWGLALPRMMASNNWVISGEKSVSGKPILANDVHLEGNRLPAVWCEMVLRCGGRYLMGGTLPGIPGVLAGRNNGVAWGVTYAFTDAEDSWIENCRDGKYYREEENRWVDFRRRAETIKRKGKPAVTLDIFENEHGVLDGDPRREGYYLATRWAAAESGAGMLKAVLGLLRVDSVDGGMELLGGVETAWNFVLADRHGDIGYQMSGLTPIRRPGVSGFVPLPGWKRENDWQGFVHPHDLPRVKNPPQGFFATANNDLNQHGRGAPINLSMGPYRALRIRDLLSLRDDFCVEDFFTMQFDVYSKQGEIFMNILRPQLPPSQAGDTLRNWDLRYDADSEGAWLFEQFYEELNREVFGNGGLGPKVVDTLRRDTGVFIDFYHNFDVVLLSENSGWFGGRSREEIFRQVAARILRGPSRKWGTSQRFMMTNIFFNGKLPRILGFDRGPFIAMGNRATIHQAQLYSSHGRRSSFLPSFRFVTDVATDEMHTTLAGSPSDRRFSRWYANRLADWLQGRFKTLTGRPPGN